MEEPVDPLSQKHANIASEEQQEVIELDVQGSSNLEGKVVMVCKIVSDKTENKAAVISVMKKSWKPYGRYEIVASKANLFVCTFEDQSMAEKILRDGPWACMGKLLVLGRWEDHQNIEDVALDKCQLWVQIHGLKLDQVTDNNAFKLGSAIGEVLESEPAQLKGGALRGFLRVRISMD